MKWKQINEFDDCLHYVVRLGVVSNYGKTPGWIPQYQKGVCAVCDRILNQSGQSTWYHKTFKPFQVRFDRKFKTFFIKGRGGVCI